MTKSRHGPADSVSVHVDHDTPRHDPGCRSVVAPLGLTTKSSSSSGIVADQDRAIVGDLRNANFAVATLDRELDRLEDPKRMRPDTVLASTVLIFFRPS